MTNVCMQSHIVVCNIASRSRLTVQISDSSNVIRVEREVGHVASVVRVHDRTLNGGVTKAEDVSQLVNGHLHQVDSCVRCIGKQLQRTIIRLCNTFYVIGSIDAEIRTRNLTLRRNKRVYVVAARMGLLPPFNFGLRL